MTQYSYPLQTAEASKAFRAKQFYNKLSELHSSEHYDLSQSKYHNALLAVGIDRFMSTAMQFSKEETQNGEIVIISVSLGAGQIRANVNKAKYNHCFGTDLNFLLVNPDSKFRSDFIDVNHLILFHPELVGHYILFIIWPNSLPLEEIMVIYDIDSIYKLQPHAVLAVYKRTGTSGSDEFCLCLHDDSIKIPESQKGVAISHMDDWVMKSVIKKHGGIPRLNDYSIEEIAHQMVWMDESCGTLVFKMVTLRQKEFSIQSPMCTST